MREFLLSGGISPLLIPAGFLPVSEIFYLKKLSVLTDKIGLSEKSHDYHS